GVGPHGDVASGGERGRVVDRGDHQPRRPGGCAEGAGAAGGDAGAAEGDDAAGAALGAVPAAVGDAGGAVGVGGGGEGWQAEGGDEGGVEGGGGGGLIPGRGAVAGELPFAARRGRLPDDGDAHAIQGVGIGDAAPGEGSDRQGDGRVVLQGGREVEDVGGVE